VAETDGTDPHFSWHFDTPLHAAVLSLEVDSQKPSTLQVFWTTVDCKVFQESCSATERIGVGPHVVDFVLSFGKALRGLRLDLPEEQGAVLRFRRIRLLSKPQIATLPQPRDGHTTTERTPTGLRISSREDDPWIVFATPWLRTERAKAIEVEMLATEQTRPHLFWHGSTCPHFKEECSVSLARVPGKPHLFRAELTPSPYWRGTAAGLRFDPGAVAGDYVLERVRIMRAPGGN
jgi:hypothetical protein